MRLATGGTYDGSPFRATASISGVNGVAGSALEGVGLTFEYFAGSTPTGTPLFGMPTMAGTYTVVALFAGSTDYASTSQSKSYVISKAVPTLNLVATAGTYNGNPFGATGSIAGLVDTPASALEGISLTLAYYAGTTDNGSPLSSAPTLTFPPFLDPCGM